MFSGERFIIDRTVIGAFQRSNRAQQSLLLCLIKADGAERMALSSLSSQTKLFRTLDLGDLLGKRQIQKHVHSKPAATSQPSYIIIKMMDPILNRDSQHADQHFNCKMALFSISLLRKVPPFSLTCR